MIVFYKELSNSAVVAYEQLGSVFLALFHLTIDFCLIFGRE